MPKKILIALPPGLLEHCDFVAQCEHRTRSDLVREALRRYCDHFRRNQVTTTVTKVALLEDEAREAVLT